LTSLFKSNPSDLGRSELNDAVFVASLVIISKQPDLNALVLDLWTFSNLLVVETVAAVVVEATVAVFEAVVAVVDDEAELKQFWHMLLVAGLPVKPQLLMQRGIFSCTLNSVSSFPVFWAMIFFGFFEFEFQRERERVWVWVVRNRGREREKGEGGIWRDWKVGNGNGIWAS
jgi:hypothetical protein